MRNLVYRIAPIALGAVLGKVLMAPPAWLDALGPGRWVVNAALVAGVVLLSVPLFVLANLPRNVAIRPGSEQDLSEEQKRLVAQYEALGFRRVGPPIRVAVAPEAIVQGFVHAREPVYATVFRTTTVPPKTSHDLVSILDGERGGLTTTAEPMGATLAAASGGFRQVLPRVSVEQLFTAHLDGLAHLRGRGLAARPVSAERFEADLREGMKRQRETFSGSPLRATWITFRRSATRKVPFVGRLREQPIAARQLESLLAGVTDRVF